MSDKFCKKCNKTKCIKEFHHDKRSKDGYRAYCKICNSKDASLWAKNNKERRNISVRAHRAKDKVGSILDLAKQRAKSNKLEFNIDRSDIFIPEKCPVLGIMIKCGNNKLSDTSPSIDRINPLLGYIKGNVRVISWRANRLKSDASIDEVKQILNYMMKNLL